MTEAAPLQAVVVTFHPGEDLEENLRAIIAECGRVIVVDNGSGPAACARIAAIGGAELMSLGANRGIAAALNAGIRRAVEQGCEWVVTFDQDSRPEPGFIAAMRATQAALPDAAVIGPNIEEIARGKYYRWLRRHPFLPGVFQRVACEGRDLADITIVITSGSFTSTAAWGKIGGFDEGLFIDLVDTDFCLRARAAGYSVAVSAAAHLKHNFGRREKRFLLGRAFHPTNHSPLRHYYMGRNRVPMLARHWRELHWCIFELAVGVFWMFRALAFEEKKARKVKAMLLGTWDGLRGLRGECPPARRAAIDDPPISR